MMPPPARDTAAGLVAPGVARMKFAPAFLVLSMAGALLAGATASAQTVYKSVGADGRIVYSDRAPTQGRLEKTMKFELASSALPASAASYMEQFRKTHPAGATPVATAKGVTLYSAAWCGYCRKAKAWLGDHGVAYTDVDIDAPGGTAALAQASGGSSGVPVLVVDGRSIKGFSAAAYDTALKSRQ
jgi:glutaredoxin